MTNRLDLSQCLSTATPLPDTEYEELLCRVEKPARYLGNEVNEVVKNLPEIKLRVALAFPDVYEVGMSHLGLKILYAIVNARPDLYAERVFAPWPDMEGLLRERCNSLVTLETGTPLSMMDVVGFSLQYELCATTVLQMLDLARIPLRAVDRSDRDPLIIGGGPAAFNPIPLSPFFDAFVIGDGEEAILELADAQIQWKEQGESRLELLARWKQLPGVFVPSLHRKGEVVSRRVVADLNAVSFPTRLVVPFCETVHDRVGLEIARGCTRGCRFCQAGMIYRPVREREQKTIVDCARTSLAETGWDEVALLSLSSGDYSSIGELIRTMTDTFARGKIALSLPSLRTDTFDTEIAEQIRKVRKTGFTLAPEAGTDRLRQIINKGNSEDDLARAVSNAFQMGWRSVKLYFMIGLPFETDEDLDGIVGLIRKASKWAKGGRVTASVSTFVPKSHTPFQWAGQISCDEIERRQQYIRRYFGSGRIRVKFHYPRVSFLEGVLARGDDRLADVIEATFRKGARFDGWDDRLRFDLWLESFREAQIDPHSYLIPRVVQSELPWSFIDAGVRPEFLREEWERAQGQETTGDCRSGDCNSCGACDFQEVRLRLAEPAKGEFHGFGGQAYDPPEPSVRRFRLRYGKLGPMRFLGHQDVVRVFHRAFRRAGLALVYSKGFHPHPRFRFSPPLGVGIESVAEYVDFDLVDCRVSPEHVLEALLHTLPEGLTPLELSETSLKESTISGRIRAITYEFTRLDSLSADEIVGKVARFDSSPTFEITRVHKGKPRTRDLKEWIQHLEFSASVLRMTVKAGQAGSVHPLDAVSGVLGLSREAARSMKVVKTDVHFRATAKENEGLSHDQ